ncbi:MAG: secretin N-terminal domain-containing protein, partial [Planctomycetota bacterium]
AGLTLDPGPVPPGTFNYFDDGEYTATEALDILNGYLLQRGYVLVRRDRFLIVANIDDGIPPNLIPDVPLNKLDQRGENELVRVILPLERGESREAVAEIGPLLGPQGEAAALTATNSVVIRDTGGNVRRIVRLLENLGAEVLFEQIPLKHLDAYDAAQTVRTQLGLPPLVNNVSSGGDDRRRSSNNDDSETSVTPDDRTNTLLVTADPVKMRVVKSIVQAIDVDEDAAGNALARGSSRPVFDSYKLETADAGEVAKTVEAMYPGTVVNEDRRARTIQIYAPPRQQEAISQMIASIDGSGSATSVSTVFPLSRLDPLSVTLTLNNMFITEGESAPVIEPDPLGRRLLIRASPDQVSEIKNLLLQLGEDGTGERMEGGTLRTVPLGGRDPERMVPLLRQMWEIRDPAPIRIVTPSVPSAIQSRGTPGGGERDSRPASSTESERRAAPPLPGFGGDFSFPQEDETPQSTPGRLTDPTAALPPAGRGAAARNADPNAPVTMTVLDGQLVLYSENEEKLNELEDLVAQVGALIPPDDGWNVFYLVNADATLTAETLDRLIPAASVSGTGTDGTMLGTMAGGLSDFGGSLMDVAGISSMGGPTTLKIVPDVRANALYVQGPRAGVRQVEQLLTVLDADSRPDNARDRLPRTIPVQHADVNEVAEIVLEVFKESTADGMAAQMASRSRGGRGGGGGDNPLAMLMGGLGGGGDAQAVQLSVGVDNRTSRLIVSAPESLFEQVQTLVTDLDEAARVAERGVQFITLRDADARSVTSALTSMMPRVSSGGSVVRSPRSTGSSGGGSSAARSGGDEAGRE